RGRRRAADPGYRAAMSTVELKARRSLGPGSGQASGDRDLRTRGEQPRDRAVHLGALHVLVELGGVHPRHLTDRVQLDPGDGRTLVLALQVHLRGGLDRGRWMPRFRQQLGEEHREAAGVGRPDQLLGVGSLALFEPGLNEYAPSYPPLPVRMTPVPSVSVPVQRAVALRILISQP